MLIHYNKDMKIYTLDFVDKDANLGLEGIYLNLILGNICICHQFKILTFLVYQHTSLNCACVMEEKTKKKKNISNFNEDLLEAVETGCKESEPVFYRGKK